MRSRSSGSNRSSRAMVAGLMVGVLVLSGSAAVGEENSPDPAVDATESASVIPQEVPIESTEAPATSAPAETAPAEATVPVDSPVDSAAVIGEPLTTEEPAADPVEPEATAAEPEPESPGDAPSKEDPAPLVGDPNIDTNLDNYSPDAPVIVTGSGWGAGETVSLALSETGEAGVIARVDAVADGSGEFTKELDLPGYVMLEAKVSAQGASGKVSEKIYAYRGTK